MRRLMRIRGVLFSGVRVQRYRRALQWGIHGRV
jgi:hypothetical protein